MPNDDPPILPTIGRVIGAAKMRLVEVRPRTARHIEGGNYAKVIAGWRAQFAKARARLAQEVLASRLPTAEGEALTQLARSEFDTPRKEGTTKALGEVVLRRTVVHYRSAFVGDPAITTADARDEASVVALLEAIAERVNEHVVDVFNTVTSQGAHSVVDGSGALAVADADMGELVGTANLFKQQINWHLGNRSVFSGAAGTYHLDADTVNTITAPDAFASAPSSAFSANSSSSRQGLLVLVNALKRAVNAHIALESRAGTIRRGSKFFVEPNPTSVPPVAGGEYAVRFDTYAKIGSQTVIAPLEAIIGGPGSNLPAWAVAPHTIVVKSRERLFDYAAALKFAPLMLRAAGGSIGQSDEELREAAAAAWTGNHGPTRGAIIAGGLRARGVARLIMLEDMTRGEVVIYPTDAQWCQSFSWLLDVEREIRDEWLGLGCKLRSGFVFNRVVRVRAEVSLRSADLLVNPSRITEALKQALVGYFDRRDGWPVFRLSSIRGILSKARPEILSCTSVTVLDANDAPIAEPPVPVAGEPLTHWIFADNALDVVYAGPS